MKTMNLGNNESLSRGMKQTPQGFLCLTYAESKWFKTAKGGAAWLAKRNINPDGSRIN